MVVCRTQFPLTYAAEKTGSPFAGFTNHLVVGVTPGAFDPISELRAPRIVPALPMFLEFSLPLVSVVEEGMTVATPQFIVTFLEVVNECCPCHKASPFSSLRFLT